MKYFERYVAEPNPGTCSPGVTWLGPDFRQPQSFGEQRDECTTIRRRKENMVYLPNDRLGRLWHRGRHQPDQRQPRQADLQYPLSHVIAPIQQPYPPGGFISTRSMSVPNR